MFTDFLRERKGERERERSIDVREIWVSSLPFVPRPRIEPVNFWCTGQRSNQLSHLARAG